MNKKNFWKDTIIVGLALFSTMFGAGNLIFPAPDRPVQRRSVGAGRAGPAAGRHHPAGAGPVGGEQRGRQGPGSDGPRVPLVLQRLLPDRLLLHRLWAPPCPKSAATTHEMAIQPLFPNVPIWITVIVFFVLVYFFACDPHSVIDKLGKYMTPILVVLLAIVLIKGVISPVGTPVDTGNSITPSAMPSSPAYNTGDLTVGIMFASVILLDLRRRGYTGAESKKGGYMAAVVSNRGALRRLRHPDLHRRLRQRCLSPGHPTDRPALRHHPVHHGSCGHGLPGRRGGPGLPDHRRGHRHHLCRLLLRLLQAEDSPTRFWCSSPASSASSWASPACRTSSTTSPPSSWWSIRP